MSVLIKGMEMPTSCDKCWALDDYGDYPRCRITEEQRVYNFRIREKRMDNCPLVPVPKHGRLIDADKFCRGISYAKADDFLKAGVISYVKAADTVMEAEGEE